MLVSIIIPCYNVEDCLTDAIESALAQDYQDVEIICVDNNSTDDTRTILENYALCYSDKVNFLSQPTQGAAAARNMGWEFSNGEWIQFLDADDIMLPNKLTTQIASIQANTEVIIGVPSYQDLEGENTVLHPWSDVWKGLAHGMYCGQTTANLYSRNGLQNVDGWNENLPDTQDTELMFRLLANDQTYLIDKLPLSVCRDRVSGKITQQDPTGILIRHLQLRNRMNIFLKNMKPDYWQKNEMFFQLAIYRLLRMLAVISIEKASELYDQLLPKGFEVQANKILKIPKWNAILANIFGFKMVESTKNKIKGIFPSSLWYSLKKWLSRF